MQPAQHSAESVKANFCAGLHTSGSRGSGKCGRSGTLEASELSRYGSSIEAAPRPEIPKKKVATGVTKSIKHHAQQHGCDLQTAVSSPDCHHIGWPSARKAGTARMRQGVEGRTSGDLPAGHARRQRLVWRRKGRDAEHVSGAGWNVAAAAAAAGVGLWCARRGLLPGSCLRL